jgi:hypothetical protein
MAFILPHIFQITQIEKKSAESAQFVDDCFSYGELLLIFNKD